MVLGLGGCLCRTRFAGCRPNSVRVWSTIGPSLPDPVQVWKLSVGSSPTSVEVGPMVAQAGRIDHASRSWSTSGQLGQRKRITWPMFATQWVKDGQRRAKCVRRRQRRAKVGPRWANVLQVSTTTGPAFSTESGQISFASGKQSTRVRIPMNVAEAGPRLGRIWPIPAKFHWC